MTLNKIRELISESKGRRGQIQDAIDIASEKLKTAQTEVKNAQDAQLIIQIVAQETQSQLEYHLNELVSLAMLAVFGKDAYSLKMQFELKRGKTEVSPIFERDGKIRKPLKSTGFGQPDVASMILRPTLWSLENNRKRPIFLYDEPLRHLNDPTNRLHEKAAKIIQEISRRLDIQIIIITQISELAGASDKVFRIGKKKERSYIVEED